MDYFGREPFDNLTGDQIRAIEAAATKLAPLEYHDGLWRDVKNALGGDGPWNNQQVKAAIKTVLENAGVANPVDKLDIL